MQRQEPLQHIQHPRHLSEDQTLVAPYSETYSTIEDNMTSKNTSTSDTASNTLGPNLVAINLNSGCCTVSVSCWQPQTADKMNAREYYD